MRQYLRSGRSCPKSANSSVALVVGTRPQIIKSIPIVREAQRRGVDIQLVHTGQHYDRLMSDVFFDIFSIPNASLNLGIGSGSQCYQTGEIIVRLDKAFQTSRPDAVLVPGDTNSAIAAGVFAAKRGIPFGHIEAGARSYDMRIQEELNRRVIDHLANSLFAVSRVCKTNLRNEGVRGRITRSGDTMFQIFSESQPSIKRSEVLSVLGLSPGDYCVLTLHRAENTATSDFIRSTLLALETLGVKVIFPVHPRTKRLISGMNRVQGSGKIVLTDPLDYFSMMRLVAESALVLTDSGGLQKEAFWSGVPCVTLRPVTEWPETVELGANFLVGADTRRMLSTARNLLYRSSDLRSRIKRAKNPYSIEGKTPGSTIVDEVLRLEHWT